MSYSYIPLGSSKPVDDKRHMKTEIMRVSEFIYVHSLSLFHANLLL